MVSVIYYLWKIDNIIILVFMDTKMGNEISHSLVLELAESVRSIKQRLGRLETDVAALRKSVINNNVGCNDHGRAISKIEGHIFNAKLMEEGRSRSVRHHKPIINNNINRGHAQSLVLK
ncbi:EsV-1-49 [Ectocarpus siliculosus virus 1]|uniref:EsV-1-49 n=1 Tax=Ectocarpus siliculosus virus 1 (isolate New Zealand/Kaikoura/1988) TaxID=654926 RepID=Q8QNL7_ESV1K|nr:EsV-1-49 [Ectocarpus siliculosus virus 1]AAK14475.1 EsV-1-49 [Ectocarpus siliculosus virus 1]